ncbi:uncharacterized protein FTJAE_2899 [Fusarium tjaetaba]|uniref:Uncharacterized protein n=1 Tax=Fusarium tjaetaba TaxID=1567544 RepID=A0A8H5W441_9HYPO|nr:uncharacterized protein FTJAE_2899 [Fusarium tjaetaba]KAF5644209.1 hypothetical protein FTJAE_2899 [Fusarium tjaetaba]
MGFKDTQDYERYTCLTGGRPDEKLPPLDFQARGHFLIFFLGTKLINTEWYCPPRPWRGLVPMARGYQRDPVRLHVVNGREPSWPRSVQTARLSTHDLASGSVHNQVDYKSAVRLVQLFNKHSPDMPPKVGEELRDMLVSGAFRHTEDSLEQPIRHQLSKEMFDAVNNKPKWFNITYERWFILVGVYGVKKLRQECQGIVDAVLTRCGEELDKSLTYKRGPDDSKPHVTALITQLSDTAAKQQKLQKEIDHLRLVVEELSAARR